MNENDRIEFKLKLTDNLEKEVVAFLNASGGTIYIGKDSQGINHTINNVDQVQLKIKDRLKHNISPSILGLFDIIEEDGIIKILIAKGSERPYYLTKKG